jgi:hypothetical protein
VSRPFAAYRGSCHCGAVAFEIDTDFPELTTCDYSICRRRNALMYCLEVFDPAGIPIRATIGAAMD